MPTYNSSTGEAKSWDILIIDIVDYSEMSETEQLEAINRLTKVIRKTKTLASTRRRDRIFLPTGDGMAIGFRGYPERPLRLAVELHRQYKKDRYQLKIGIHSGIAFDIKDVNNNTNIAGSGINFAQRTLSCCSKGHILVANELGKSLIGVRQWAGKLHGPYEFRVKHNRTLLAFNFFESDKFGNETEPSINRIYPIDYSSLKERLAKHGVVGVDPLRSDKALNRLNNPVVIENVILESAISGFIGVKQEKIRVELTKEPPRLPDHVNETKNLIPEPDPNRPKVVMVGWSAPISDKGSILELRLGSSDFWTTLAIQQSISQIQSAILDGSIQMSNLPMQLDTFMTVITADQKLLLCRRSDSVKFEKLTWSATIGESIDAQKDINDKGVVDPDLTIRRALKEELGLPEEAIVSSDITFLAIAPEWHYLLQNLIAIVRLRSLGAEQVKDCFWHAAEDRGEHIDFDWVDFTPTRCLDLVFQGRYAAKGRKDTEDKLLSASRLAILASLFNELGYSQVMECL